MWNVLLNQDAGLALQTWRGPWPRVDAWKVHCAMSSQGHRWSQSLCLPSTHLCAQSQGISDQQVKTSSCHSPQMLTLFGIQPECLDHTPSNPTGPTCSSQTLQTRVKYTHPKAWSCKQTKCSYSGLGLWFENQLFSSVAQSCPTLCNPMDCSTPGIPVHHQLPEFTQTHVHWVRFENRHGN